MDCGNLSFVICFKQIHEDSIIRKALFLYSQMDYLLPVPKYWITTVMCFDDWVYLAGGYGSNHQLTTSFHKINLVTGEVEALPNLRNKCRHGILVPAFTQ